MRAKEFDTYDIKTIIDVDAAVTPLMTSADQSGTRRGEREIMAINDNDNNGGSMTE